MANHRLDFPDPTQQLPFGEFSPTSKPASTNGVVYNFIRNRWVAYIPIDTESGASVEVGETPPQNPEVGDLWWDSSDDSGRLFVWYDDGNTSQWVDASPDSLGHSVNSGENWPSVANENDLFFRTSDGRLYIYYKDDDSLQWIDASTYSPASELWVKIGPDLSPAEDTDNVVIGGGDITLNADGSAIFGSGSFYTNDTDVQVTGDSTSAKLTINSPANTSFSLSCINNSGAYFALRDEAQSRDVFYVDNLGSLWFGGSLPQTPSIKITRNGPYLANSGANQAMDLGTSWTPGDRLTIFALRSDTSIPGSGPLVVNMKTDGSAYFAGTVTAAGHVFNLEADDDTKYTTATDAEGNETRVYNGATLDVKERILNLVARLDAIEANEMIDDATDTSLLQLLASANARIDSIEQRLAALEGVSN